MLDLGFGVKVFRSLGLLKGPGDLNRRADPRTDPNSTAVRFAPVAGALSTLGMSQGDFNLEA